ncbi:MAG: ribosome biogenesis GTPase YqeH [Bacilli bacterium]|nr:ribosome biogenesis GTPase YqeH [Bacilli bacterium]
MEELKCIGCGSILQTENSNQVGYIPPHKLTEDADEILCQRCFRIKHYRDLPDIELNHEDFVKILNDIAKTDALVINVVDLFDLTGSLIHGIHRYIGNNDLILVGNKRDILPKAINNDKIKNWIRKIISDYGYQVKDIILISSKRGDGIDELFTTIEKYRKDRNVYVIGCTNVGKSTLINAIIKRFTPITKDVITASIYPGTTLGLIEIPLDDNHFIIDTPGIINHHQYAFYLDKNHLKHILPDREINPKVYQLNPRQTLFIDGLARIDFVSGKRTSFVCHFSNAVKIHRTKLENADNLFAKHLGELLSPPTKEEYEKLGKYVKYEFKTPKERSDIVISGLGFISLKDENLKVVVHAPKHVGVYIRPSLY